ncbi:PstS family phosphate ABC transporter substrate-binding protein [Candidatus Albibeggiatoa sp. nov. BB20]|uniref:PstS family phosphate ABC transporter substrate-binding protein n=1 Tax=Candidatus Albibeggiatoa sp. nov. BB20 TaxID=3162723 RepID=UPI00336560B1
MRITLFLIALMSYSTLFADSLNYEGSSTVGKFITDAAKHYNAVEFKINTVSESAGGEQCTLRQRCDMGGVARDIKQRYLEAGLISTLVGRDAIAVLVNENNPISSLSKQQLKDVFSGKITNWSELGGIDMQIKVYVVKAASATRHVFASTILDGEKYDKVKTITPDAKIASLVAKQAGAIGQLSFAFIKGKKGIKALSIEGQNATVNNSQYPITRPLYIVTKGKPNTKVKAFLDWALSEQGQAVVKQRFVGAY